MGKAPVPHAVRRRLGRLAAQARALDAADPLARFRQRFVAPRGIYLDGNSLGPLPRATAVRMRQVVEGEWAQSLIGAWNSAGWIDLPERVGAQIAPLIGAAPHEVIACDSVSVNLFRLVVAALRRNPGRRLVLAEAGDFPTDAHAAAAACRLAGGELLLVPRAEIAGRLGPDVALLLLCHAHFRTAALWDITAMTAAAHAAGALVLWDLSHSAGAVDVRLGAADFAVGCGYKYLCGGPGAPAFAFVAARHLERLDQPIAGWMGHADPFGFDQAHRPAPGIRRLLAGTPPILGLAALDEGVKLVAEAGLPGIAAKAQALGDLFIDCVEALGDPNVEIASPRAPRGGHVLLAHAAAFGLVQALIARGVTGDFRPPDGARFGFSPLPLSHAQVVEAAARLGAVLALGEAHDPRFVRRGMVT